MNYATQVGLPTAHITKKKSRLKVYNGLNVFLNDKDNFEFELHNPTQKTVLCKIKLNGNYISSSGIILRPGQRVFLERFLDTNNKFEFSTYEVKNNSKNRSAIDLNGDISIEFYNEQEYWYNSYRSHTGGNSTLIIGNTPYWNGLTYTTNLSGHYAGTPYTTLSNNSGFGIGSSNTAYFSNSVSNCSIKNEKNIETGRVEKGEKSEQSFINSYEQFNSYPSYSFSYKILPIGTKNKSVDEIRHYCTECGTKMKKNYKFCPSCGNKI